MPKGKPSAESKYCPCGKTGNCTRCKCCKLGRSCFDCAAYNCSNLHTQAEIIGPILKTSDPNTHHMLEISEVPTKMLLENAYSKVILWKPNLMHLPRCNASNEFISILADLYLKASSSSVESKNALKVATVLCQTVLQSRRIREWKSGHILELFTEAHILQKQKMREIKLTSKNDKGKWQKDFVKLMRTGKASSAIYLLKSGEKQKGIHNLDTILHDKTVRNILTELHPDPRGVNDQMTISSRCASRHHPMIFEDIDAKDIKEIFSLPSRLGGLGIINKCEPSNSEWNYCKRICAPVLSGLSGDLLITEEHVVLTQVKDDNCEELDAKFRLILSTLPSDIKRILEFASAKGASSWLSFKSLKAQFSTRVFADVIYIKEFINGDLRRTEPSISSLIKRDCVVLNLDVMFAANFVSYKISWAIVRCGFHLIQNLIRCGWHRERVARFLYKIFKTCFGTVVPCLAGNSQHIFTEIQIPAPGFTVGLTTHDIRQ
ncbi:hypothetical protein GJ496_000605 [Pomphorhynchus laevis]|nr:hypothetical protein GJ496_000605 [Pomphorhynchus laevis]